MGDSHGRGSLSPGRTWRLGWAADVFGPSPQCQYYPTGEVGRQMARPPQSKGVKAEQRTVTPGELYKCPAYHSAPSLTQSLEEPGVFAGFSAKLNLPVITGAWGPRAG